MSITRTRTRTLAAAALVGVAALGLTACSAGNSAQTGTPAPTSFTTASWAMPVVPVGEWLNSAATEEMRVDVYLADIVTATEDSSWEIRETGEAFFLAGDEIQVIQFIVTNTGTEPIIIGSGELDTSFDYRDFGTRTIPTESRFDELLPAGLFSSANDYEQTDLNDFSDDRYDRPVGPGESISWAEVLMYRPDDRLTVRLRLWTYLGDGEWDYGKAAFDADNVLLSEG